MDLLFRGLGRLPGDVRIRAGRATVPFPVTSTILVVTTLALALAACNEAIATALR